MYTVVSYFHKVSINWCTACCIGSCMLALLCHDAHCRDRDRGCTNNNYRKQCNKRVKEKREAINKQYVISGLIHLQDRK